MKMHKYLFLSFLLMYPSLFLNAQGWEKSFDVGIGDYAKGVIVNPDKTFYVHGYSNTAIAGEDVQFISKRDSLGAEIWTNTYELGGSHYLYEVFKSSSGGFIGVGVASPTGSWQGLVVKLDSLGNYLSQELFLLNGWQTLHLSSVRPTSDNAIIISAAPANVGIGNNSASAYLKMDLEGNIIWSKIFDLDQDSLGGYSDYGQDILESRDGGYVAISTTGAKGLTWLLKLDIDGNMLWEKPYGNTTDNRLHFDFVFEMPDSTILISGLRFGIGFSPFLRLFEKTNADGLHIETLFADYRLGELKRISDDGNLLFLGSETYNSMGYHLSKLYQTDSQLNLQWSETYSGGLQNSLIGLEEFENGYLVYGHLYLPQLPDEDIYLVKTDSNGISWPNWIGGNIFHDSLENCAFDTNEPPRKNYFVEITENGETISFTSSDSLGNFRARVDTGTYSVKSEAYIPYWQFCEDSVQVILADLFDTAQVNMPVQAVIDCPYLEIDFTTDRIRNCNITPPTYSAHYCNHGTIPAENAYVEITLDTFLAYTGSSIPLASQNGQLLTFDLGMVGVGECGDFTVNVEVSCDAILGQTHCSSAHIYPDSLCLPAPLWSGAQIAVEAFCADDTIYFTVKNIGNAPTSQPLDYIVIEDDVILMQAPLPILAPSQIQQFHFVANGATYRLTAQQEPDFPGNWSHPTAVVEACGNSGFSFGFVNQFPQDDASPFHEIDCRENVGSFDPNDKQAFPTGYGDEHFIAQNVDIEYLIRFQNTGTDTAFTVVVRDTLSPFLNPATLRPGASSHPYSFDISGDGLLKFTFNNILLLDSTTNEAASHGFVKFRASQKQDVPLGSLIENNAAIFFDFNAPIVTNTTWHTVGKNLFLTDVHFVDNQPVEVKIFPNPVNQTALLTVEGPRLPDGSELCLFDLTGREALRLPFSENKVLLDGGALLPGVYLFQIRSEMGFVAAGKLVVVK